MNDNEKEYLIRESILDLERLRKFPNDKKLLETTIQSWYNRLEDLKKTNDALTEIIQLLYDIKKILEEINNDC